MPLFCIFCQAKIYLQKRDIGKDKKSSANIKSIAKLFCVHKHLREACKNLRKLLRMRAKERSGDKVNKLSWRKKKTDRFESFALAKSQKTLTLNLHQYRRSGLQFLFQKSLYEHYTHFLRIGIIVIFNGV